ncbi:uncharacterized protein LOC143331784 isoform X1 [Chaetodon auriga]|uniref:uncharacterized protein LOC143331784 isoform X1 n=1 Tax=Chaetodon auriga TaxID=39042 RepID=UPI00403306B2
MKSAPFLFLFLLLCLSPAVSQGQLEASVHQEDDVRTGLEDVRTGADVPLELPVLWDELWGLKELVLSLKAAEVEQRQALRSMESRLRDGEVEAERQRRGLDGLEEMVVQQKKELRSTQARMEDDRKLVMELNSDMRRKAEELEEQSKAQTVTFKAEVSTLQSRLNTSESSVEDLEKKNTALAAELPFLQTRLRASESTVEQLRRKSAVLAVRLCNTESLMEELMKQTSAFPSSNSSSPSEASELESRLSVRLEELDTNTQALQSRLNTLQEKLNASAETHEQRFIHDQILELSSRLNLSQRHLEELERTSAGRLRSVERRVDELRTEDTALTDRLSAGERRLDELQAQTTDQTSKLNKLQRNANTTERLLDRTTTDLEVRLRSTESQLENHTAALEVRLSVSEKQLEHLKAENTVQSVQLNWMESRLTDSHNNTAALELRLRSTESQLDGLKAENTVLSSRLNETEDRLLNLTNTKSDKLKVAFSAGLTDSGSVGPFDEETTLIFSKTITNIGRGYNQTAGVFAAPVRGLYFFSFTVADYLKGYMGLYLYRNNQPIIFNLDLNDHGGYASTSNGVALQLEEGDRVRLSLPASYRLYDDSRNFSVFSGFLLFPL